MTPETLAPVLTAIAQGHSHFWELREVCGLGRGRTCYYLRLLIEQGAIVRTRYGCYSIAPTPAVGVSEMPPRTRDQWKRGMRVDFMFVKDSALSFPEQAALVNIQP